MTVATEVAGYIAGRTLTVVGRQVVKGQPVPEDCATPSNLALGWVKAVDAGDYAIAVAEHGAPPAKLSTGWDYETEQGPRVDRAPKAVKPKKPKKRKRAKKHSRRS